MWYEATDTSRTPADHLLLGYYGSMSALRRLIYIPATRSSLRTNIWRVCTLLARAVYSAQLRSVGLVNIGCDDPSVVTGDIPDEFRAKRSFAGDCTSPCCTVARLGRREYSLQEEQVITTDRHTVLFEHLLELRECSIQTFAATPPYQCVLTRHQHISVWVKYFHHFVIMLLLQ